MIEVRAAPREHFPWIATRAQLFIPANFRAIEAVDGHRILGMVGYDAWTPNSCSMHVAIDEPIAIRRLIKPAFEYPFVTHGRGVVLGAVFSNNPKALKLNLHLGFRQRLTIRDGWEKGVDVIVLEMRREDCRWLG